MAQNFMLLDIFILCYFVINLFEEKIRTPRTRHLADGGVTTTGGDESVETFTGQL